MPAIEPGELSTEFTAMQNSAWWGKAMIVLGVLSTTVSGIVAGIHEYQATVTVAAGGAVPGGSQLAFGLMVCGIILAVIGGVQKALTEASYISGRSLLKAAAARDVPPPPMV